MKQLLSILIIAILLIGCEKKEDIDVDYVTARFKEYSNRIEKVEFKAHRIDTFQSGSVWNNTGFAHIEKDSTDKIFGFSFYGKRNDFPKEYIYDNGIGFEISKEEEIYKTERGNKGFLGRPGGQMIPPNLFQLDSVYKSVLLNPTDSSYILKYEFEDDTVFHRTNIITMIELSRDNFFPVKVTRTARQLEHRTFHQILLNDVKINEEVQNSIDDYKMAFGEFKIIQPGISQKNKLLLIEIPSIGLPVLFNQSEIIELPYGKLTLIDFWEVWCGPCIASFPKVEALKNEYSPDLRVVGIVTDNFGDAIKLLEKSEVTFLNLVGNNELIEQFSVRGWPTYFLVDKNGILQKEYFGFSEQIEEDIKEFIGK